MCSQDLAGYFFAGISEEEATAALFALGAQRRVDAAEACNWVMQRHGET